MNTICLLKLVNKLLVNDERLLWAKVLRFKYEIRVRLFLSRGG